MSGIARRETDRVGTDDSLKLLASVKTKFYVVWELMEDRSKALFYCESAVTIMTRQFSYATICDSRKQIRKALGNAKVGNYRIHKASESEIFKGQLADRAPHLKQDRRKECGHQSFTG